MSSEPLRRQVTITNPMGFHLRPIAAFAKLAATFTSNVTVWKGDRRVNGKSALELLSLAAEQGVELIVEVSGPDAPAALDALARLLALPNLDDEDDPESPVSGKGS